MKRHSAEKLIKNLPIFYIVMTLVFVTIAWMIWNKIDSKVIEDTPNLVALIIETGIGIAITVTIFVYSKKQGDNLEKMTEEVQNFVHSQNKLHSDEKNVYARTFVTWVHNINFNFEFIIKLYKEYIAESNFVFRESIRKSIMERYDRDLIHNIPKIDYKDLLKSFGKDVADTVWQSQALLLSETWNPRDNESMTTFVNNYVECIKKAISLKDIFLEFCDQQIKNQDEMDKEINDRINSTEAFRV